MVFILFGSVNYPIAVIVRTLYFSQIFMVEATVITILIIRQVIIFKVIIEQEYLERDSRHPPVCPSLLFNIVLNNPANQALSFPVCDIQSWTEKTSE